MPSMGQWGQNWVEPAGMWEFLGTVWEALPSMEIGLGNLIYYKEYLISLPMELIPSFHSTLTIPIYHNHRSRFFLLFK